jgi:hypothetical protein
MLIAYLTIGAVLVFVLLLAGYLIAIAWALTRARRNVIRLAETLERTADKTTALQSRIDRADHGLAELAAKMRQATWALTRAVTMFDHKIPT